MSFHVKAARRLREMRLLDDVLPAVVLTVILTAGFFVSDLVIPGTSIRPLCLLHTLTGLDCPGCGLTRAFLLIPKGEWRQVMALNAAAPVLYLIFVLSWAKIVARLSGKGLPLSRDRWNSLQFSLGLIAVILMLGHWVVKMESFFSQNSLSSVVMYMSEFRVFGGLF